MRRNFSKDRCRWVMLLMVCFLTLPPTALASDTTINNIREGLHPEYTRIVFDCSGEAPEQIGPAQASYVTLRYTGLAVIPALEEISSGLRGGVDRIELIEGDRDTEIRLSFKTPGARVKPMVIPSASNSGTDYRLVLDIYSAPSAATTIAATAASPAEASTGPLTVSAEVTSAAAVVAVPMVAAANESIEKKDNVDFAAPADTPAASDLPVVEQDEPAAAVESDTTSESPGLVVSAEASLILRSVDGEEDSAKFEEYRDITAPVSGDLEINVEKDRDYYLRGKAVGIGQDDQVVGAEGGRYGKFGLYLLTLFL